MASPYIRDTIENWVSDFCLSDDLRPFSPTVKEIASDVLVQFLEAACESRQIEPQDLEELDIKHGLLNRLARLDLAQDLKRDFPSLCAALLTHLEKAGRLGGGAVLGAYARAMQGAFEEAASGKKKPVTRPGSKIGRNDPCPCGSGLKYKKCCMTSA
jgi:hypothetical protein